MRIQTLQGYDLHSFGGPIELDRGTYSYDGSIVAAQRRLYDLIGEDQIVWCSQDEMLLCGQTDRFIHDIEVDTRDIVTVIDSLVWCHILNYGARYILPQEHCYLRRGAAMSSDNYEAALRQAEDEYLAANLPDDLWMNVRKSAVSKKSDQLLLKFPFEFSKITNVEFITDGMANTGRRTEALR